MSNKKKIEKELFEEPVTEIFTEDGDVKLNTEFYKELYKIAMVAVRNEILSGNADIKYINTVIAEVKRLEIAVHEDDVEVITSFMNTVRSGGAKAIELPTNLNSH